jgi:hypothetical protein
MVFVRMKALPPDSALAIDFNGGKRPWTISEYLLADIWELHANKGNKRGVKPKRHPARPAAKKHIRTPEQQRRHDAAIRRHRRLYQQHYGS